VLNIGAVQHYLARQGRPYAHQSAGERGFAGGGRPDNAQPLACFQVEADIANNRLWRSRSAHEEGFDRNPLCRRRELERMVRLA
jgi:hypothetical protein